MRVTREGALLRGPGIGDDCRGLAVVLAVARALNEANVETEVTVYPLEEANGALDDIRRGRVNGAAVLEIRRS